MRFNLSERRAYRRVAVDNVQQQILSSAYMLIIIISVMVDAGEGKGQPRAANQIPLIRDSANYEILSEVY